MLKFKKSEKLEALGRTIAAKRAEVDALYDQIGDNDPTPEQMTAVKDGNKWIEEHEVKYQDLHDLEAGKSANKSRLAELREPQRPSGGYAADEDRAAKSIGRIVTDDEAFKSWIDENRQRGEAPKGFKSPAVDVGSFKSLVTGASDASAGALVRREYDPTVPLPMRPLSIRDIIDVGATGSDLVEYVRQVSRTNNAAVVAEATSTGGASGLKPESGFVLEVVQATVKTLATWIPVTRRALADAAQIRSMIDGELRFMVAELFEAQVVAGDGTGENFTGVINTSGMTAQTFVTDKLTTLRKARTKCRTIGRAIPNATVMNPLDWESLDLLKDGEARYYYGGPAVLGSPRIWGVPVVEHEDMPQNRAIMGDWKVVKVWDREATEVLASDSHADFFIRNLIALLAEMRAAMGVKRPAALVDTALV